MQTNTFNKRIFTFTTFQSSLEQIFSHLDDLRAAARSQRVSKAFAEKIMLVVSQVNGCRYCSYGHSRAALAAGVSQEEIQQIMQGEIGQFPQSEAVALVFAQHFAETGCQPEPVAWERLEQVYGVETAKDILAYLRMITFGNLFGNTFDALLSRLAGKPAAGSSLSNELGVILGAFVIAPFGILSRLLGRLFRRTETSISNT